MAYAVQYLPALAGSGRRGRRWIQATMLGLVLMVVATGAISAHGEDGQLQVADARAGPYAVDVWTAPGILLVGEMHVETEVSRDGKRTFDSAVTVKVSPLRRQGDVTTVRASAADGAHRFRHEAAIQINWPGRYRVDIVVADVAGSVGEASFEVFVRRRQTWVIWLLNLLLLGTGATGFWLMGEGWRVLGRSFHPAATYEREQVNRESYLVRGSTFCTRRLERWRISFTHGRSGRSRGW